MRTTKRPRQPSSTKLAHLDRLLDEALRQTFPASDPVAITTDPDFTDRRSGPRSGRRAKPGASPGRARKQRLR